MGEGTARASGGNVLAGKSGEGAARQSGANALAQKLGERAARASGTRGPGGKRWREGGNSCSWRYFANANRGDWLVKNAKWFCRSLCLFRKDKIASKIVAGDPL